MFIKVSLSPFFYAVILTGLCSYLPIANAADWHVPTPNSLQTAVNDANSGDNIIIDSNITSDLTLGTNIDKALHYSSNPPGPFAINMYTGTAANTSRHFSFTAGATGTTFTNISLNNIQNIAAANSVSFGGAIYTDGAHLTLNAVKFGGTQGNRAANAGGAIYSTGGNLIINDDSAFTLGTAQSATGTGGAIYIENANLATNGTVDFTTNKAAMGGAIYTKDATTALGDATSFTSNQATGGAGSAGGAIYNNGGTMNLGATTFVSNTATGGSGGAIYNAGTLALGTAGFNLNTALNGAAIYNAGTLANIGAATFTNNTASGSGGAIYNVGSDLTMAGTVFSGNKSNLANIGGGAIYNVGHDITIAGGTIFTSNTANGAGGAIYNNGGNITITGDASFTLNRGMVGGAIFAQGTDITMNIAGTDADNMTLFQGNNSNGNIDSTRKTGAGAVFFDGITAVTDSAFGPDFDPSACALCITYAKFDANKSTNSVAGALFINNTTATISNSIFSDNSTTTTAGTMGGAIYNGPGAKTYIENSSFINNSTTASAAYAGAIYNSGFMKLKNVTVSGNSAKTWGGAVLSGGNFNNGEGEFAAEMTVADSYFYQNSSTGGGGALGNADNSTRMDIINTRFVENSANHGGAFYNETVAAISGSEFINNIGTLGGTGGGAIWSAANWAIGEKLDLTVDNSTFTGNQSNSAGGAIYLNISSTTTTDANYPEWKYPDTNTTIIKNSTFTNNQTITTGNGGAIFADVFLGGSLVQDRKLILDIDNVVFDGNSAGGNGGALYVNTGYADIANGKVGSANVTISDTDFLDNSAATSGGAIYSSMTGAGTISNLALDNIDFDSNMAGTAGGALYLSGQSATTRQNTSINNSTFTDNKINRTAITGTSYNLTGGAINIAQHTDLVFQGDIGFDGNGIDGSLTNIGTGLANYSLTVSSLGGGIYTATTSTVDFGTVIPQFTDNYAKAFTDTTNSGTFASTANANAHGGAFYDSTPGTINFNSGTIFSGNYTYAEARSANLGTGAATATANAMGGSIYNSGNGIINISDSSSFTDNSVTAVATATGSAAKTMNANAMGGAIYNVGTNSELNIAGVAKTGIDETRVTFVGNSANGSATNSFGGAIYNSGKLSIENALFENNYSAGVGGAIYSTNLPLLFDGVEFVGNSSDVAGGAVYLNPTSGTFNLAGSVTFDGNSSLDGGAIYSKITTNVSDTILFTDNSATQFGGAWYIHSGTVNLNGATFSGNSATAGGGAIYNNGTLVVNGGTSFANNSSATTGGAIYTVQAMTLNSTGGDINFTGNTAGGVGNDISVGGATARAISVNGTANSVIMNGGFATNGTPTSGNHSIVKTGAGNLLITGDNFGFTGISTISGGQVIVDGKWINGLTTVNAALLRVTSDTVHERVTVSNTAGVFEHLSNSLTRSNIENTNFKFSVASGGTMKFMADSSLAGQLAKYNLANNLAFTTSGVNNVLFQNSDVTFGTNSYQKNVNGWINYTFQDSVINLSNAARETTTFQQVTLDNAKLSFDVAFKTDGTLESDRLAVTTLGGNNTIKLGDVSLQNGLDDNGLAKVYTSQVLMPAGLNFDSSLTATVESGIYEYLATVSGKNITLTAVGAASENSLYIANAKSGTRAFNMTYFGAAPYTYNIGQSLGTTTAGTFSVLGNSAATSIISGILVDSDGTPIGGNGSFFDISGATNLTLGNISIVDAAKAGNGSVLSVTGAGSTVSLNSLILARNTSDANGGAIYNERNITFTGTNQLNENSAVNGGAIYNSGTVTVGGGASFANNTASTNGGAIYNSGTLVLNSTAGNITFSGNTATGNGNDIYNNAGTINISGTANDVIIGGGISGNGNINKSGAGRLLINGDSSGFHGTFAQSVGTSIFTTAMFDGVMNVTGGAMELANGGAFSTNSIVALGGAGTLNISTTSNITMSGGNLTGYSGTFGTVNKSGSGDLTLAGNNSVFQGTYNQTSGRTLVDATSLMFNGTNNISNSILQITSPTVYEKANIGNNGQLIHIATIGATSAINSGNANLAFTGTGGSMSFTADASLSNGASYNLANKIDNGNTNTVSFDKSNVFLGATNYTGGTIYAFTDSVIDLNSGTLSNVAFSKTNLSNAKLSFDTRFDVSGGNMVLASDTFNAGTLLGDTTIGVGIIRILNDNDDTGLSGSYTSQVLSDASALTFGGTSDTVHLSTNVYEYTVSTSGKNVQLSVINASDMNSLYRMNNTANKRGFNISYFSGTTVYYNIGQSLGVTKDGEFIVQGFDNDPEHGVISGRIVDANGDYTDEYGSLFKLAGTTNFTLKNLTIEDSRTTGNGSVVYMTGGASNALLENLIAQNNESTGAGGAVYASSGALHIGNSVFDSNTAGTDGGAIYNSASGASISATSFESNTATGNGGAVYNSGTVTFANLTEFMRNYGTNGGAIYNSGTTTFTDVVTFDTNSGVSGGAIYNAGGTLRMLGATDIANNSAVDGGALYLSAGTVTIDGSSNMTINTATGGNGGAAYVANGATLNINNNALIADNTAADRGGAVYLAGTMNLGGASATSILFSGNSDASGDNDIYIADTGLLSVTGAGTYDFDSGIAGDTGSRISIGGTGARFDADMTNFAGNYSQSGASSIAQIFGLLNANYTITNGTARFVDHALSAGKTITVNGAGIAQYSGAGSDNLGTVTGSGTLIVANTLTNTGMIDVGTLTINSALVNNGTIDSNNTAINAAVTNNAVISGTGISTIANGGSLSNLGTVQQNRLIINSGGTATSSATDLTIANGITNNGTLIFNAGTNSNIVSGNGLVRITGDVDSLANISAYDLEIISGARFDTDISKIAITAPIQNEGTVALSGNGAWATNITGTDGIATFASGSVNNTALIQQKGFIVKGDATFTTDGGLIQTGTDGVTVNGTMNITQGNLTASTMNLTQSGVTDTPVLSLLSSSSVTGGSVLSLGALSADTGTRISMDIFSNGQSDLIDVSGAAVMNGELHIHVGVGTYRNKTFTLLNASSLSGDLIDDIASGNTPTLAFIDASNLSDARYEYRYDVDSNTITLFFNGINASNFAHMSGLTFNQSEAAKAVDAVSRTAVGDITNIINNMIDMNNDAVVRDTLSELSPYFLANILRPTTDGANRAHLYGRIKDYCKDCAGNGLWVDGGIQNFSLSADDNSIGQLTSSQTGASFGYDHYFPESDFMLGVFGAFAPGAADQGSHHAEIQSMGGGLYFGMLRDKWDIKSVVGFDMNAYSTSRRIYNAALNLDRTATADFGGYAADMDLEFGYKFDLNDTMVLRPYLGGAAQMLSYDGFTETGADSLNMDVSPGSNLGMSARAGVGIEQKMARTSWYASAEYNVIMAGNYIELETKFIDTDVEFLSRGADTGTGIIGLNAGIDYNIAKGFDAYASANYRMGGGFSGFGARLGFRYTFCSDKKVSHAEHAEPREPVRVGGPYFPADKYNLTLSSKKDIKDIVDEYKDTAVKFVIEGHSDTLGTEKGNLNVSEKRAHNVAQYMVDVGVDPEKIEHRGVGSDEPDAISLYPYGRAHNRRVDILMF